jgi:hypothetical protein
MQQKPIFGIGLSKTGTTSLTRALQLLGYRTNHFPYSALRFHSGRLSLDLQRIRRWDAATDSPIALFYRQLEDRFPEGKFILTQRDVDAWLDSCQHNHVWPGNFVRDRAIRLLPHIRKILCLHRHVFGSEKFQRDVFRKAFEDHNLSVINHFRRKKRELLVIDICAGDGWEELCEFLGRPIPEFPFPYENVGKLKRLKSVSRRFLWHGLSLLPTPTLNEKRVQRIIASGAYSD